MGAISTKDGRQPFDGDRGQGRLIESSHGRLLTSAA